MRPLGKPSVTQAHVPDSKMNMAVDRYRVSRVLYLNVCPRIAINHAKPVRHALKRHWRVNARLQVPGCTERGRCCSTYVYEVHAACNCAMTATLLHHVGRHGVQVGVEPRVRRVADEHDAHGQTASAQQQQDAKHALTTRPLLAPSCVSWALGLSAPHGSPVGRGEHNASPRHAPRLEQRSGAEHEGNAHDAELAQDQHQAPPVQLGPE
jgi:hypothetical protein